MRGFLSLAPWQLFMLLYILPIGGLGAFYVNGINSWSIAVGVIAILVVIAAVPIAVATNILWFAATVHALRERKEFMSPHEPQAFVEPAIGLMSFSIIALLILGLAAPVLLQPILGWVLLIAYVICRIYLGKLLAESLNKVESNRHRDDDRKLRFREYFGDFILTILLPIGVWILQPRIRTVFTKEEEIERNLPLDSNLH